MSFLKRILDVIRASDDFVFADANMSSTPALEVTSKLVESFAKLVHASIHYRGRYQYQLDASKRAILTETTIQWMVNRKRSAYR